MKLKVLGRYSLCSVLEKLCILAMVAGGGILLLLPFLLNYYFRLVGYQNPDAFRVPMLVVLYVSGICAFAILWLLRRILKNVNYADPFTAENARMIKIIGYLCLPVAAIYFIAIGFLQSVFVLCVALAFSFVAALTMVLAELFRKAVEFKQENDLTI